MPNQKNSNVVIVGAQWGDEGKGKVVDLYSAKADLIVRYQGGNNAGHTLVVNGKKTVVHLVPSGILHPGKLNLIANGVVFDPVVFFEEVESLKQSGAFASHSAEEVIKVSERAHVILPYHRTIDRLREEHGGKTQEGKGKIGTTVRGIGPAYEDKVARRGIQVVDLLRPDLLRQKLVRAIEEKNILLQHFFGAPKIELEPLFEECRKYGDRLRPYIADVRALLMEAERGSKKILFEGAQGTLLDVDHGTYPYVTSSSTVSGGAFTGAGVGPHAVTHVIGITKAYTTRVGTGPFPSEIEATEPVVAKRIRDIGQEYGATTGRPRRVGWLDLVALRYACEVNGLTGLAVMKADVLTGMDEIKVCTSYRLDGHPLHELPSCVEDLERVEPVYQSFPGWKAYDTTKVKHFNDLPGELKNYLGWISEKTGVPLVLVSVGPGREETLELSNPFVSGAGL